MTAQEDFWLTMSGGARVVEIDRVECRRLLDAKRVGRLGFVGEDGPVILPMNYLPSGDRIIVRTLAYGIAARSVIDQPVAFEVDEVDDFLQTGWSVLASGVARLLNPDQVEALRLGSAPEPWVEGPRTLFLSINCDRLTGRQLIPR